MNGIVWVRIPLGNALARKKLSPKFRMRMSHMQEAFLYLSTSVAFYSITNGGKCTTTVLVLAKSQPQIAREEQENTKKKAK